MLYDGFKGFRSIEHHLMYYHIDLVFLIYLHSFAPLWLVLVIRQIMLFIIFFDENIPAPVTSRVAYIVFSVMSVSR